MSNQASDASQSALTRRSFLRNTATVLASVSAEAGAARAQTSQPTPRSSSFLDLLRSPDRITAYGGFTGTVPSNPFPLQRQGSEWSGQHQVVVESKVDARSLIFALSSPGTSIAVVHVRWRARVAEDLQVLGDAWERSYGELGFRGLTAERVLPWYFATHDGHDSHAYGVQTGAAALCFWQLDPQGVSLWLNVANGGNGVELGSRRLTMATVVTRKGSNGESPVEAVTAFCRQMCARPSRPLAPIYGANDWNYSYGRSTAETILRDTEFIVELSPTGEVRPFSVIDDGWSKGPPAWPDMSKLAEDIRHRHARPGIWIRPLQAVGQPDARLLLPGARFGEKNGRAREFAFDPTIPEAQEVIRGKVKQVRDWGYEMVKHDFSSYELLGQWGFEMGPQPTVPGWSLHDRTRTNAEVISALYAMLRQEAGETVLLEGCNTVGHLGQGIFDLERIGDDTSGREWERTRRMGVNTLCFRLPQQGTFFAVDADLVGITDAIPWSLNQQWLEVTARSGAVTMVSPGPPSRGQAQREAIREAFAIAAAGGLAARPRDWTESSTPQRWQGKDGQEKNYDWNGEAGASPFMVS